MVLRWHAQIADRGVSPVIGVVLLVAITVLLAAVAGAVAFGLTDQQDPAPSAKFAIEPIPATDDYRLVHDSGDRIDGDQVTIRGVEDADALAGRTLTAGATVRVTPTEETVRLVWKENQRAPSSYTLWTFEVSAAPLAATLPDGVVFTGTSGGIRNISGDGGSTSLISTTTTPTGIGPASDIDSDGTIEIPYVDSSGNVRLVTAGGSETLLADHSSISGSILTTKTRLAVGTWNGSARSVFFANASSPTAIYRVTPAGSVSVVATPSDGADGVVGPADIDDDGTDELVFIDGSQTIRYLEDDGGTATTGVTAGSSTGVGGGSTADFDGDGGVEVAVVDGGNNVVIADASGSDSIGSSDVNGGSAPQAKQSPATAADVDDDGSPELVYIANSDGNLNYLDNIDGAGTIDIRQMTDDTGNQISGDVETGAT